MSAAMSSYSSAAMSGYSLSERASFTRTKQPSARVCSSRDAFRRQAPTSVVVVGTAVAHSRRENTDSSSTSTTNHQPPPTMARINIPPLTRSSLLVCLCLSVLSGALRYRAWMQSQSAGDTPDTQFFTVPFLAVVPALSITYPWTFVSATLVETNIFTLTITLATLFYGGKYLERAWGSSEFGKFLLVVAVVPNFLAFLFYIAWFAATGNVVRSYALPPSSAPAFLTPNTASPPSVAASRCRPASSSPSSSWSQNTP